MFNNCYAQVFLKEFKYISDDLESSSDDSDDSDEK